MASPRQPDLAHRRHDRVERCWLCGIALPTGQLVPDGGSGCADVRWYCRDMRACTHRWTTARPSAAGPGNAARPPADSPGNAATSTAGLPAASPGNMASSAARPPADSPGNAATSAARPPAADPGKAATGTRKP